MNKCGIKIVVRGREGRLMNAWARVEIKSSEPIVEKAAAIRMGMVMAR